MKIRFLGKNLVVTKGMQEHLREKILRLDRYAPRLVESHAVLKKEKYFFEAEMTLLAKNFRAYGEGQSKENIYSAIDLAYSRIEKQLKKYRGKLKSHHKKDGVRGVSEKTLTADILKEKEDPFEKKPEVLRVTEFVTKPMSAEEASLQLVASSKPFLVFANALTNQVNVIYKRDDGRHGLIEPNH